MLSVDFALWAALPRYDGVATAKFCWIAALLALPFTFSFLLMDCEKPEISNLTLHQQRSVESNLRYVTCTFLLSFLLSTHALLFFFFLRNLTRLLWLVACVNFAL